MINNLNKGLSGCKIEFDDLTNSVRKTSSNISYNSRLNQQIRKQILFSNFSIDGISTPKIKFICDETELSYFEMDYISGKSPYELFVTGSKHDIDNFLQSIKNYLNFILSTRKDVDISEFNIKISKKINSLHDKSNYKEFINFLELKSKNTNLKFFSKSFCHGDLTMSNMICDKNIIYLIDFLDSFIDSPIIDFVKLKQDLFYNWSLNNLEKFTNQDLYKVNQVSKFIWNEIYILYRDIIESSEFDILESINFLRIEPYLSDDMMLALDKIIKSLKLYEEFNNTNVR